MVVTGRVSGSEMGDEGDGSLFSPDGVAPSHIVGVSAFDVFPCTIKSRRRFLLAPAHPGSPGKKTVNGCVCSCVCVIIPQKRIKTMVTCII